MYDVIIIGSGVAGLSAAIYARRFEMKTIVIGELRGGAIAQTHLVENYPGFISLSGFELAQKILTHAENLQAEFRNEKVENIEKLERCFRVKFGKENLETKSLIIATGTSHRKLEVKGEKQFANRGVSYCATCDAAFFKGKTVAVVGGSDSAVKESLVAAKHAAQVIILYRGEKLRAEPINIRRMTAEKNISVKCGVNITEIYGENFVKGVNLDSGEDLKLDGVFVEVGRIANSELGRQLGCELNAKGEIKISRFGQTNVAGVFAAGDVTDADWKQAITGVAEGAHAANQAFEFISKIND